MLLSRFLRPVFSGPCCRQMSSSQRPHFSSRKVKRIIEPETGRELPKVLTGLEGHEEARYGQG